ncbi:MAG: hypothetical protein C0602_11370 [Denitrovibrio sp.]|nr:MAG: hypothetical protein C0602_11370 [Denitrovibrio sp.]
MSKKLSYEELEQRVRELEAYKTLQEKTSTEGLMENIQAGIVVHGADGTVINSNTAAQTMLGLTCKQMIGKELVDPVWKFSREDGSALPVEEYPVSQVIATKKPVYNLVFAIERSDKDDPIWASVTSVPKLDEKGLINQIVTTFMDVSALKVDLDKYRSLFENTMHEVHLWKLVRDEQGYIKTWRLVNANPAALKAWGKTLSEVIGKTTDDIFSHNATEQFMPIVEKIFSEGKPYTWEAYFQPTDENLHMTSVPFGEYFMSTGTDVSFLKKAEQELDNINKHLEERVNEEIEKRQMHEKTIFEQKKFIDMGQMINAIAHQWRQPLNNITLTSQMMKEIYHGHDFDVEYDYLAGQLTEMVKHMSETIDDFRNFFSPNKQKVWYSIVKEILSATDLIKAQLDNNGIEIFFRCDCSNNNFECTEYFSSKYCDKEKYSIFGYPNELIQVYFNLISNAKDAILEASSNDNSVKKKIGVFISVGMNEYKIRVFNCGKQISAEVMPNIFNPYFTTKE